MKKLFILLALAPLALQAQNNTGDNVVVYHFQNGTDMFDAKVEDNKESLKTFYEFIDQHKDQIQNGNEAVYVDGYGPYKGVVYIRCNRVKSEFILRKGLNEDNFITTNNVGDYNGQQNVVVVNIAPRDGSKPAEPAPVKEEPKKEEPKKAEPAPAPTPVKEEPKKEEPKKADPAPAPAPAPAQAVKEEPKAEPEKAEKEKSNKPYCFAVRTNLLYDVMLLPTLGIEWRATPAFGIKLDGSWSNWKFKEGKVQDMWMVSPELRWYLGANKRWYVGLGGNFGDANVNGGILGAGLNALYLEDTGFDGVFYGGGLVGGYQWRLSRSFSIDFNLGLGATYFDYTGYTYDNTGARTNEWLDTKTAWPVTQAGISLVWTIGGPKE